MKRAAVPVIALLLSCSMLAFFWDRPRTFQKNKALIDTFVTVTVVADSAGKADAAIDAAFSEVERFGGMIDFFSASSELAEVNRSAGLRPVKVSAETLALFRNAVEISRLSGGAFDPTIGPVMQLWNFPGRVRPSAPDLRSRLALVDYRNIVIDESQSTVFLRKKGMLVDLGGIAKGYAADLAVDRLKALGVPAALVAIAGDIRGYGRKPDGSAWQIGVRNPRPKQDGEDIIARLPLRDRAISTAGDYERFFIENGVRYHHILDPKSGMPAQGCISVSVISEAGVRSDGIDNALFVLGPEQGMQLARRLGVDAIIMDSAGKIHMSDGLKGDLTFVAHH